MGAFIKFWVLSLTFLFTNCILLTNCAPDRNLEDYRREQKVKEQNKFKAIEGNYTGFIVWGEGPKAPISLDFRLSSKTINPTGSLTQEEMTLLDLTLLTQAEKDLRAEFYDLAFDDVLGEITGSKSLNTDDGLSKTYIFKAYRKGDSHLEGKLFEKGSEALAASFQVSTQGIPLGSDENTETLKTQNFKQSPFREFFFEGFAQIPHLNNHSVSATFQGEQIEESEEFFQKLGSTVYIRAAVNLSPFVQIVFEKAKWNRLSQELKGESQIEGIDGGALIKVWLQCKNFNLFSNAPFSCFYATDQKTERVSFELSPSAALATAASLPDFRRNYSITQKNSEFLGSKLELRKFSASRLRDLREIFLYKMSLRAFLVFSKDIQYTLEPVFVQKQDGFLSSASLVNSFGSNFSVFFDCNPGAHSTNFLWDPLQWDCEYRTSVTGGTLPLNFERQTFEK